MNEVNRAAPEAVDFGAALSPADLERVEAAETGPGEWAVARRAALAVLTRSATELREGWAHPEAAQGMMDAVDMVSAWAEHLQQVRQLAQAAHARLLLTAAQVSEAGRLQ